MFVNSNSFSDASIFNSTMQPAKRRKTNSEEESHDLNYPPQQSPPYLPTGLSPKLVSLCSSAGSNDRLVNKLAEDPLNLIAFFEAATSDPEWYQANIDLSRNIVSKISALTLEHDELQSSVDRICSLMRNRMPLAIKSEFDIAFSMLKSLKDMLLAKFGISKYYQPIDPSMLPELTKLAMAAKDETLTKKCLKQLQEIYGIPLSLHGLRQVYIEIDSNTVDVQKIRTLISDLGNRLPIVFDISPPGGFDINTLQELIPLCKGRIAVLILNKLGDLITQDLVNACVSNEPNLCHLSLDSKNLTHLKLNDLQSLRLVAIQGCPPLELVLDSLPSLEEIIFPLFNNRTIDKVVLNNLNSVRALDLSSLNGLKALSITSLPELTDISMPAQPKLKDITVKNNDKLLDLNLSNLDLERLDLQGSFNNLRFSQTSFTDPCFDLFVEQLPTWAGLKRINLAGEMTQVRFDRLIPHLEQLSLTSLIPPTGVRLPDSLRSICPNSPNPLSFSFTGASFLTDIEIIRQATLNVIEPIRIASIDCNRDTIKLGFTAYLLDLKQKLTPETKKLKVHFENEHGVDDGGLTREFITLIFSEVSKKLLTSGMPNLEKSQYFLKIDASNAEKVFEAIGTVLGFILKTVQSYPAGHVFSLEFFESLKNNSKALLDKTYTDLTIDELGSLSTSTFSNTHKLHLFSRMSKSSLSEDPATLQAIRDLYKACERDLPDLNNFEASKEEIRILLLKCCESEIRPMCAIVKGFHQMVGDVSHLDVEAIQQKIAGVSSAQLIVQALNYTDNIPPKLRTALENWIETTKPERLHTFLQFLCGSKTLPVGQPIIIQGVLGSYFFGHSCGFQLDIPIAMEETDLTAMLDGLTKDKQVFTAL